MKRSVCRAYTSVVLKVERWPSLGCLQPRWAAATQPVRMISRGCLACSSAHVWRSVLRCAGAHTSVLGVRGSSPSVSASFEVTVARLRLTSRCLAAPPQETHARSAARRSVHSSCTATHATAGHSSSAAKRSVALLPGNGVGPEIADAVVHVFDVAGAPIEWDWVNEYALPGPDGGDHIIRDNALETIKRHGIALKGACALHPSRPQLANCVGRCHG